MCRHAAYVGPGIALNELMLDLDHSLLHQSYQPRELLSGVVCADGFGVGWYDDDVRPEAGRFVSPMPIWSDVSLPSFGGLVRSRMVLGAVRNGTIAGNNTATNCAPFQDGRYLWSLNGALEAFQEAWREPLLEWITPARRDAIHGNSDGEYLFQAFLSRLDEAERGRGDLLTVMQAFLRDVMDQAEATGTEAQINVLASDGERLLATRAGSRSRQNSLYHLVDGDEFPDAHVVASEPLYDDPAWEPVEPDSILVLQQESPRVRMKV